MAYSRDYIEQMKSKLTSFRGEECLITFYLESSYFEGCSRDDMIPVATYLYATGVSISESVSELPSYQSYGSNTKNIHATGVVESTLNIEGLYVQEGQNPNDTGVTPDWLVPGLELIAYIDYIDSDKRQKSPGDWNNENLEYTQTIVIRNLRRLNRGITANHGASITYGLSFVGGSVITLPIGYMDINQY